MRRLLILSLAVTAILVFGTLAATAANAASPEVLPTPTEKEPLKFETQQKTESNFLETEASGSKVECKAVRSLGEFTSNTLGKASIAITSCKLNKNGTKCLSLGASPGEILLSNVIVGLVTVDLSGGELMLGILTSLPVALLHIECGITLLLVGGSLIGVFDLKASESGTKGEESVEFYLQNKGVQEVKTCKEPKSTCSGKTFGLYSELGKGREGAGLQSEDTIKLELTTKFKEGVAFDF